MTAAMARTVQIRIVAAFAVLVVGVFGCSGVALAAAPGSFDGSFGGSGVVPLGAGVQVFGVAVQSDGGVVAAGQSGGRVLVERLGSGGQLAGSYLGPAGYARAVGVAPDGKIVVAGSSGGAMFVERLTSSLAPDSGFGSAGVALAFAGQSGVANGVAVGPGGSVVAAGSEGGVTGVAQFSAAGTLQWTQSGFGGNAALNAVAIQPDGKVVVVGAQNAGRFINGLIARLTSGGALDSAFAGGHGAFTYSFPSSGYTSLNAVALQNNGQIVAAGVAETPDAIIVRINSDGSLDSSFGSAGAAALPSGEDVLVPDYPIGAYGVGIAGGGRIVAAGNFEVTGTEVDQALWAFTPSGGAESAFTGGAGTTSGGPGTVRGPTGTFEACGMAVAPDGSLVAVGNAVGLLPDSSPCTVGSGGNGFVSRLIGFGPPPPPNAAPTVSTGGASAISAVGAQISGQVNPNGLTTTYHFEYGQTSAYGLATLVGSAGAGNSPVTESATLTGLQPATTYHYRLVAINSDGTSNGSDGTLSTSSSAPSALTGQATGVGEVSAAVAGTVATNGLSTSYHFDYGTTVAYGRSMSATILAPSGTSIPVSKRLTGLRPGTKYHYRLVAQNADGTTHGGDRTFTTVPRLHASLVAVPGSYSSARVEKKGLQVRFTCSQACSVIGSLVISGGTARRLRLAKRQIIIASGSTRLRHAGSGRAHVGLSRSGERLLSRLGPLGVTLRLVVKPTGGGPAVTKSKTVTLV
jgi:uncharacterized delta-60 repeat protein